MIEAILIGLAAWRIASLLVNEAGPFDIFERLRLFIGLRPGPVEGFLPKLFDCVYCMSVWTTVLCYGLWQIEQTIVIVLAAMTIALVADRATR